MPPAKHQTIEKHLRARVQELEVGTKLPAVAALSQELRVSPGTVHRAIENLVQEGMLERRPNRGAFVSRPWFQARHVGVIFTDIMEQVTGERITKHPYMLATFHAVQEEAAKLGRSILFTSNMDPAHPQFLGRTGEVGGVIILHNYDVRLVEAYTSRGIPVVLVDPLVRPHGIPFLTTDHYAEFHDATQYLLGLGHERILHLTVNEHLRIPRAGGGYRVYNHIVDERIGGFRDAMAEAERAEGAHVYRVDRVPWKPEAVEALDRLIRDTGATACLCFNDDLAACFIGFCRDRGIRVPDDMAVMGDDTTGLASRLTPSLTCIRIPFETIGREAVRLLGRLMREDALTGPGIVLPFEISVRASTGSADDSAWTTMYAGKEVMVGSPDGKTTGFPRSFADLPRLGVTCLGDIKEDCHEAKKRIHVD